MDRAQLRPLGRAGVLLSDNGPHWHSPTRGSRCRGAAIRRAARYLARRAEPDAGNPEAECVKQPQGGAPKGAACRTPNLRREPLAAVRRAGFEGNRGVEPAIRASTSTRCARAATCSTPLAVTSKSGAARRSSGTRAPPTTRLPAAAAQGGLPEGARWSGERGAETNVPRARDDEAHVDRCASNAIWWAAARLGGSISRPVAPAASCVQARRKRQQVRPRH